jgi:hypothetical protein
MRFTSAILVLLAAARFASAAIDGAVINATFTKPQAGATVTLYQTTQQGPQNLGSVKTDADGKFTFDKDVQPGVGGGPLLLQAVYQGVQYNKTIAPGESVTNVGVLVYESSKKQGDAKIEQHMILLEPSTDGNLQVSESYIFKNDGPRTWNDPDNGTLQFALPADARSDKVEVNVLSPGGLPIRRAPDPAGKPNTFKVDFPIKPGDSRVDLAWSMPFRTPGVFEEHIVTKGGLTRLVAPQGVEFKAPDLRTLGQEPNTKATIYEIKGPDVKVDVQGTGGLNGASGGSQGQGNNGPGLSENLPKLYGLMTSNSSLLQTLLAVKWILLTVLGMLALGFILLYRKGNPIEPAEDNVRKDKRPETTTKASRHARGLG